MKVAGTVLGFCVAALLALGMVMIYSASIEMEVRKTQTLIGAQDLVKQLVWCALGLVSCVAAALVDYRLLKKFVWPLMTLIIVLLVLVRVPPLGKRIKGASRWFSFHGISFQ